MKPTYPLLTLACWLLTSLAAAQAAPEAGAAPDDSPAAAPAASSPKAAPEAPPDAPPKAAQAPGAPRAAAPPSAPTPGPKGVPVAGPSDARRMQRELERIGKLPQAEAAQAVERLTRDAAGQADGGAGLSGTSQAGADALPGRREPTTEAGRVQEAARTFFARMLAGDARSLVEASAVPFQLEDRRIATPEELMQEWLKALRAKRTDLLKLYGIEVLTPAEMEKKYGKPPARLSALPWKAPKTYLAVANLSGRAALALFKDSGGGTWKVVGYHD